MTRSESSFETSLVRPWFTRNHGLSIAAIHVYQASHHAGTENKSSRVPFIQFMDAVIPFKVIST